MVRVDQIVVYINLLQVYLQLQNHISLIWSKFSIMQKFNSLKQKMKQFETFNSGGIRLNNLIVIRGGVGNTTCANSECHNKICDGSEYTNIGCTNDVCNTRHQTNQACQNGFCEGGIS